MTLNEFKIKYPNVELNDLYNLFEVKGALPKNYAFFIDYIKKEAIGKTVIQLPRFYPTHGRNEGLRAMWLDECSCIYQLQKDGHKVENMYYSGNGNHNGFKIYLK